MNNCPLYELCTKFRKNAEEGNGQEADKTTCYNPGWLLANGKKCENYHPELRLKSKKKRVTKVKQTDEDFREEAKKQIAEKSTSVGVIERCLKAGIANKEEILKELIRIFPNVKESKHRRKIPLTIKYLKETRRMK